MTLAVIFGLSGAHVIPDEQSFFKDANPAGYVLFARNIENPQQLRALTDSLRDLAGRNNLPILIDQEGGRIARLGPPQWRAWPAAAALVGVSDSPVSSDLDRAIARVQCNYEALGLELAAMGINVTCAPVLDVPQPDAHDIIGDRAFASAPEIVGKLGRACLAGLQLAGVAGVIKHMPGHGRALSDSHESLPRVAASERELAADLAPFTALADASMAMTAHVIYEAWDPEHCASVSTRVITEQIRECIGFDGLLISDDLNMKALSGDLPTRAAAVLAAGCDIALNCWGRLDDMKGIAEQVPAMTAEATGRLARACAPLRVAQASSALNARIDELVAQRESLV